MKLTPEDVRQIGDLAKMTLSDEEVARFAVQLTDILTNFDVLGEVDTDGVEGMIQGVYQENVFVGDEIAMCPIEKELVACAPHDIEDGMIALPKIM